MKKNKNDQQKMSGMKPWIDQYKWKELDFRSESKDSKMFGNNNKINSQVGSYSRHFKTIQSI